MRLIYILFFLISCQFIFCQATAFDDLSNKCQKKYKKAIEQIEKKRLDKATPLIKEVVQSNPNFVDGQKKLISLYLKDGKPELANAQLKFIIDNKLTNEPKVIMTLVDQLESQENYKEAVKYIELLALNPTLNNEIKPFILRRYEELKFREYTYSHPVPFNPEPLSSNINTTNSECLPALNAEGSILIYTSFNQAAGRNRHEDLYISYVDEEGNFGMGQSITALNTYENEGAHTFSQDGTMIVFTACNRRDSYGGCDLYISFYKNGKWSEAYNMGPQINSRYAEKQPSISYDNKTLYFSSTRKGGIGKEDIWMVKLQGSSWGEPVNLGPTINTKGNEGSPFIHADNTTLYFRSDGHIGLGDYDLFLSQYKSDNWTTPKNLGYPINSKGNDGALFVDLFGQDAYYTSDQLNDGKHLDILKFKLPEDLKPAPVTYLSIHVYDAQTKEKITAIASITDLNGASTKNELVINEGGATIIFPQGNYALSISKEGFLFHSENIDLHKDATQLEPLKFDVYLNPIKHEAKKHEAIILKNIFFESGSSTLLSISNNEIELLYNLLNKKPDLKIKITGYTDNVGNEKDNLVLSEQRAKAVFDALVIRGISKNRMSFVGKGEAEPIADNTTELGRQANRRTTFEIVD